MGARGPFRDRFFAQVQPTRRKNGCWIWIGAVSDSGYGVIRLGKKDNFRMIGAHVASYIIHKGKVPKGKFVLHKCDVMVCVNPRHLFSGTQGDNVRDCRAKGRTRIGENHPDALLTNRQAARVKKLLADGLRPVDIARKFSVPPRIIYFIRYGTTWRHVEAA